MNPPSTPKKGPRLLRSLLFLSYPLGLAVLALLHTAYPQRSGFLALTQVFAPHLFMLLPLYLPWLVRRRFSAIHLTVITCALLFALRYGPQWPPREVTAPLDAETMTIATWNVHVANELTTDDYEALMARQAGVIVLQECRWQALEEDAEVQAAYPYRLVHPSKGLPPGFALLSRYPILEYGSLTEPAGVWDIPRVLWAQVQLPSGRDLTVVTAHPVSPLGGRPRGLYDPALRDCQLAALGEFLAVRLARGERVILAGDLNLTEREPAYRDLSHHLTDAFEAVGAGYGPTWGARSIFQYVRLLRIDHLMSGEQVLPRDVGTDCRWLGSDHCILYGRFAVP
ncbi:MAG: endonuclease/exonuclease/phosphatase family protein [Anaerolineae bacterium]|nr:endonuclease/exonuclease/phosphatase family protein [Anaerolineae bacterium]